MPESTTDLVVCFTPRSVYAGPLGGDLSLVGSAGDGLLGPAIESTTMIDPRDGIPKVYAVDGAHSKVVDVINDRITNWAEDVAELNLGKLLATCSLITTYLGSIVIAAPADQGGLWAMSRKFDPLDWRISALPLATTAVAGSDPTLGQPADNIRALITYGHDYLLFGCQSSIYYMIGDPRAGGFVAPLPGRRVGVLGPRAFCFDDKGILWFLGNDGLNVLASVPGEPRLILGNKAQGLLERIDPTVTLIQMKFNAYRKEIFIGLTPRDGTTQATHVIIDTRTGSVETGPGVFLDQYPLSHGPWAMCEIDGDDDQDRQILLGSNDGYIRRHDESTKSDDGTAIEAYYDVGPFQVDNGQSSSVIAELLPFSYGTCDPVTFEWYTGLTPDVVRPLNSSPPQSGTIFATAGYNKPVRFRRRGGAHKLRIKQTSSTLGFAIESIQAKFERGGRRT